MHMIKVNSVFMKMGAFIVSFFLVPFASFAADKVVGKPVIACIGDSITFGVGAGDRVRLSYPSQLREMLGDRFAVKNYGANGTTYAYWAQLPEERLKAIADANPVSVVILLGTNDSKTGAAKALPRLEEFMEKVITRLSALPGNPKIYIALPPPAFGNTFSIQGKVITEELIPRIKAEAAKFNLPVIDTHTPFAGEPTHFPDGVHPDAEGAKLIAKAVAKAMPEESR
jgi:acyl-CoA thioesterase I